MNSQSNPVKASPEVHRWLDEVVMAGGLRKWWGLQAKGAESPLPWLLDPDMKFLWLLVNGINQQLMELELRNLDVLSFAATFLTMSQMACRSGNLETNCCVETHLIWGQRVERIIKDLIALKCGIAKASTLFFDGRDILFADEREILTLQLKHLFDLVEVFNKLPEAARGEPIDTEALAATDESSAAVKLAIFESAAHAVMLDDGRQMFRVIAETGEILAFGPLFS